MRKIIAVIGAAVTVAIGGLVMTSGASGATSPARDQSCTQADGLCLVVEYVTVRRNGTHQVWTCYLTRLPAPEGHGVKFPGYTCVLPGQTP